MTLLNKMMFLAAALFTIGASAQSNFETMDLRRRHPVETRMTVECSSSGYRYNTCQVGEGIRAVYLASQISRTQCIEGENWGYTYDSIWVDKGCRGRFDVILSSRHGGGGGRDRDYSETISCSSSGYRYASCAPTQGTNIAYVELASQVSRTACVEGDTWGYDYNRVWVDKGCRGTFRVYFR